MMLAVQPDLRARALLTRMQHTHCGCCRSMSSVAAVHKRRSATQALEPAC